MVGLAHSLAMAARSAPSANILVRSPFIEVPTSPRSPADNPRNGFEQARDGKVRRGDRRASVASIHEHRPATGCAAGGDVAVAVTDDYALRKVEAILLGGGKQKARTRLAAIAAVAIVM